MKTWLQVLAFVALVVIVAGAALVANGKEAHAEQERGLIASCNETIALAEVVRSHHEAEISDADLLRRDRLFHAIEDWWAGLAARLESVEYEGRDLYFAIAQGLWTDKGWIAAEAEADAVHRLFTRSAYEGPALRGVDHVSLLAWRQALNFLSERALRFARAGRSAEALRDLQGAVDIADCLSVGQEPHSVRWYTALASRGSALRRLSDIILQAEGSVAPYRAWVEKLIAKKDWRRALQRVALQELNDASARDVGTLSRRGNKVLPTLSSFSIGDLGEEARKNMRATQEQFELWREDLVSPDPERRIREWNDLHRNQCRSHTQAMMLQDAMRWGRLLRLLDLREARERRGKWPEKLPTARGGVFLDDLFVLERDGSTIRLALDVPRTKFFAYYAKRWNIDLPTCP